MSAWHRLCAVAELVNGGQRMFEIAGEPVLVVNVNRVLHAVRNRCTHLDFPLAGGRLLGCELVCRQHGARFDLRDGRALGGPAVDRLRVYPTRVVEGFLEVEA